MVCQRCHKREANVHYTQIVNGSKVELYLCRQCADENSKLAFSPQLSLGNLLWGFPGFGENTGFAEFEQPPVSRCNICGISFDDFRKTGKVGCANCYRVFRENMSPILRRLHGNTDHTGKIPVKLSDAIKNTNQIEKLKAELSSAIESEQYEKAAELRDKIRSLENIGDKSGGE